MSMVATLIATTLFAIVGGPSVGKTSIIEELKQMGEETVREVATDYILEQQQCGVTEPWNKDDFQLTILNRHLSREINAIEKASSLKKKRIFTDRGVLDGFVYLDIRNKLKSPEFTTIKDIVSQISLKDHYRAVFFVLPHNGEMFEASITKARHEQTAESVRLSDLTKKVYVEACSDVILVPAKMTPKERAQFILSKVDSMQEIDSKLESSGFLVSS